MCVKINLQRIYLLAHIPTHLTRPVSLGIVKATPWSDALFQGYVKDAEHQIKEGGYNPTFLRKDEIERWGYTAPPDSGVMVIPANVPRIWLG